jgi:hypothetical protein
MPTLSPPACSASSDFFCGITALCALLLEGSSRGFGTSGVFRDGFCATQGGSGRGSNRGQSPGGVRYVSGQIRLIYWCSDRVSRDNHAIRGTHLLHEQASTTITEYSIDGHPGHGSFVVSSSRRAVVVNRNLGYTLEF